MWIPTSPLFRSAITCFSLPSSPSSRRKPWHHNPLLCMFLPPGAECCSLTQGTVSPSCPLRFPTLYTAELPESSYCYGFWRLSHTGLQLYNLDPPSKAITSWLSGQLKRFYDSASLPPRILTSMQAVPHFVPTRTICSVLLRCHSYKDVLPPIRNNIVENVFIKTSQ